MSDDLVAVLLVRSSWWTRPGSMPERSFLPGPLGKHCIMDLSQDAKTAARQAANSKSLEWLARLGLISRGVVYLLIGALALQIAFGESGSQADQGGAVRAIASKPFGEALLWILAFGFAGLALWRFSEAAFGNGKGERAKSFARGLLYAFFAVSTFAFVLGTSGSAAEDSDQKSAGATARVMEHTGGRLLVGLAGLVLIGIGCYMAYEGVTKKFLEKLKTGEMSRRARQVVEKLGVFGSVARGVVFGLAGVFVFYAAITFDPDKAKGLDGTLHSLVAAPLGPYLRGLVALGLIAFGVFSMCEARWRRI